MALTFEVCRTRTSSASISMEDNAVDAKENKSQTIEFLVIASGIDDPFDVTEISAMRANGVPLLRQSVYVDPDGTVFPYFACMSKSATRNPSNPYVFNVTCDYEDTSGEEGQDLQSDPENYAPTIKWDVKSRQRVSWVDANGKAYVMPTGSKYKTPLKLDYPCLVATITQFENTFSKTALKDRYLKTNAEAWQGIPIGAALVTSIKYTEVMVPVGGAGVITGYAPAYKVTYIIEENQLVLKEGSGVYADATKSDKKVYWQQARPQIDSLSVWTINGERVVRPTAKQNPILSQVYINKDSGKYWAGPNLGNFEDLVPQLQTYAVYESDSYNYLRV